MRTVGSRCPFATSQTLSIPHVVRISNIGSHKVRFLFDQPINRIVDDATVAAQFLFQLDFGSANGSFAETISSTLIEVGYIGPFPTANSVQYVPDGEHLTSRLAGELATFDELIPFP